MWSITLQVNTCIKLYSFIAGILYLSRFRIPFPNAYFYSQESMTEFYAIFTKRLPPELMSFFSPLMTSRCEALISERVIKASCS